MKRSRAVEIDRLDRFVATKRPRTLMGAAVKLRRLLDPDTGIAVGQARWMSFPSHRVLALIHRLAGAPKHPIIRQATDLILINPEIRGAGSRWAPPDWKPMDAPKMRRRTAP
jgi:hypothetical protein